MNKPREEIVDMIFGMEWLQRLGFEVNQLSAQILNVLGVGPACCVVLEAQGKQFIWVTAKRPKINDDDFMREWSEAIAVWNANVGKPHDIWDFAIDGEAFLQKHGGAPAVVASVLAKGIKLPSSMS